MLTHFQSTADYEKTVQEAIGFDKERFEQVRNALFKRWCEKPLFPSVESGLVLRMVGKQLPSAPLDCALLTDNLEFFSVNYRPIYEAKLELALKKACLCGAKKIALFLLEALKTNFTHPNRHYLLEYVMTSNITWAQEIGKDLIKAGQTEMPKGISTFPTVEEYSKIQDLFKSKDLENGTDEKKDISLKGKLGNS